MSTPLHAKLYIFLKRNKSASARLATYGLRLAMPGGSMLLRKAVVLIEHSTAAGDKGNMPLHRGMPTPER